MLNKDGDSAARFSTYVDATLTNFDDNGMKFVDLWRTVRQFTERPEGLTSGLMWLRLFARSGVDIDIPTIAGYNNLILERDPTLAQGAILMEAILDSTWTKPMGRQELQPIVAKAMAFFQPAVRTSLQSSSNMSPACVLLYYHSRSGIETNGEELPHLSDAHYRYAFCFMAVKGACYSPQAWLIKRRSSNSLLGAQTRNRMIELCIEQ